MSKALSKAFVLVGVMASIATVGACNDDDKNSGTTPTPTPTTDGGVTPATKDIVDTALAAGNFKTLTAALTKAGLVDALKGAGPFTVFAPTDAAFEKLGDITGLTAEQLTPILGYHVYKGIAKAADVAGLNGQIVKTLNETADIAITVSGKDVIINNGKKRAAKVTQTDIETTNGVIHVIDTVLDPNDKPVDVVQTAIDNGNFTALAGALTKADLVTTLKGAGPFTVFAPTDAAFAKLGDISTLTKDQLAPILKYHVLPAKTIAADVVKADGTRVPTVLSSAGNGADSTKQVKITVKDGKVLLDYAVNVTTTDIIATNGVVHVIDNVLSTDDIVGTVIKLESDKTEANKNGLFQLRSALAQAELVTALQADGPFTVFAPTNDAFAGSLPAGVVTELFKNENKAKLQQVLKYHVLPAAVTVADVLLLDGKETPVATLEGGLKIKIGVAIKDVFLNPEVPATTPGSNAKLVNSEIVPSRKGTDIFTRNGIIHVIDKVLVPSDVTLPVIPNP